MTSPVQEIVSHIQRAPGSDLTFKTEGLAKPADLTLIPFYRVHHERHTVYWQTQEVRRMQAKIEETTRSPSIEQEVIQPFAVSASNTRPTNFL